MARSSALSIAAAGFALLPMLANSARAEAPQSASADSSLAEYCKSASIRASELAQRGDVAGADKIVAEVAKRVGEGDAFVDELRGAVLTAERKFPEAEASFRSMLEKTPASVVARFNIAETLFLQGRYGEAQAAFAELEATHTGVEPSTLALCRYKEALCLLAVGSIAEAEKLAQAKRGGTDSPSERFSQAAIHFARRNYAKAEQSLAQARSATQANLAAAYTDSLIELGWAVCDAKGVPHFARASN